MAASGHIAQMRPRTRSISKCLDENDEIDGSKLVGRRGHGKRLYPLPSDTNMATNPCGPEEKAKRARRGYFCEQTNEWVDDNPLESSWWKLY
jgi:hypothetical protein